jgi:hypothetical protein
MSMAIVLTILCLSHAVTSIQFWRVMKQGNKNGCQETPVVPYWLPGVFHALSFLDPPGFITRLM